MSRRACCSTASTRSASATSCGRWRSPAGSPSASTSRCSTAAACRRAPSCPPASSSSTCRRSATTPQHRLVSHEPGRSVDGRAAGPRPPRARDVPPRRGPTSSSSSCTRSAAASSSSSCGRCSTRPPPRRRRPAGACPASATSSSDATTAAATTSGPSRLRQRHLDAVLVHSDPAFARFEESFRPTTPLARAGPPHRLRRPATAAPARRRLPPAAARVGGRRHGRRGPARRRRPTRRAALRARTGLTTTLVAGPFLPDAARRRLCDVAPRGRARGRRSRRRPVRRDGRARRRRVSQAGYNTTMDLLRAGRPAVVVPFADGGEDEQTRRAERMAALGVLRAVPADRPDRRPARRRGRRRRRRRRRRRSRLDLDGRERSAAIVADLVAGAAAGRGAVSGAGSTRCGRRSTRPPVRCPCVLPRRRRRVGRRRAVGAARRVRRTPGSPSTSPPSRCAVTASCGRASCARGSHDGLVRVHQHGFAHIEPRAGRAQVRVRRRPRPPAARRADVAAGRDAARGPPRRPIDPVFTPPWNRCIGRHRRRRARRRPRRAVARRQRRAPRPARPRRGPGADRLVGPPQGHAGRRSSAATPSPPTSPAGGPVGVMLHHAVMDADDRRHLAALLALVAASPAAIPTTLLALATPSVRPRLLRERTGATST